MLHSSFGAQKDDGNVRPVRIPQVQAISPHFVLRISDRLRSQRFKTVLRDSNGESAETGLVRRGL